MFHRQVPTQAGPLGAGLGILLCILCCTLAGCYRRPTPRPAPPPTPSEFLGTPVSIHLTKDKLAFEVVDIAIIDIAKLEIDPLDLLNSEKDTSKLENWTRLFAVYANKEKLEAVKDQPPIVGRYRLRGSTLRFEPTYPLTPGVPYLAVLNLAAVTHGSSEPKEDQFITAVFAAPKPQTLPTIVDRVYPTPEVLPENLLKFYIHFSAPMSRGEAYEHIKLLDAAGKPIDGAFLELGEELWDPAGKRFTLLFDPGRIKHGLKPREDLGPVLEAGKSYTLVIDKGWHDANGEPLKEHYRKPFKVGPQFDKPVDPKSWKIQPPAGKNEPLVVTLPRPHDRALLLREVWVIDSDGNKLAGSPLVSDEETRWQFTPEADWKPGKYRLVAKMTVEDLAGNKVGRLFEVDQFGPIEKEVKSGTVQLPFEVGR